ncbi:NAD(P)-dependent oxidoreductase [Pelagicoccus sp. SDUM812002]|uniref:NAD(P)-dependent oxidoreductase n=1 Tax=Pelagicoccus sp. SDUM812002 TaxID=3041266 RepID=UPI00280CB85A|nr:NAD(P)-dependent oxidoreductase [Pelagicoccus sp. SDUM812002]MDQ8187358.1 NAD(P)-dependent oxidoreductase [Pelagicoccus sp. SDUM812002]
MENSAKQKIAFIGTGVMGASMAGHLLAAGYPVCVYNRTRSKADALVEAGAVWKDSPFEAAQGADVVITIVGYPSDVEAIYLGERGIVSALGEGAIAVDMTTSSPLLAQRIAEVAGRRGIGVLDAPVSGGDLGAREACLSIMVGGARIDFEKAKPILAAMGKNIVYQGEAGSGQHTKMCNQIAIAGGMVAIGESMAYAKKAGLDAETVLESISAGAAGSWSLSNLVPRALKGDYSPGFFVKHFVKDMKIALESAEEMQLELSGLAMAKRLFDELVATGGEEDGTQALFRLFWERE